MRTRAHGAHAHFRMIHDNSKRLLTAAVSHDASPLQAVSDAALTRRGENVTSMWKTLYHFVTRLSILRYYFLFDKNTCCIFMKSFLKFRYACTAKQVEQEGTKKMNE